MATLDINELTIKYHELLRQARIKRDEAIALEKEARRIQLEIRLQ